MILKIDDGFSITKGSKVNAEYWISEINKLVESIEIDKFKYGPRVEFLDLVIYKGNRFHNNGCFDIKIHQKEQNLYAYIPQKSNHRKNTIKNCALNELKQYIKYNSEKFNFLKLRNKFFDRLRNRGFRKYCLSKRFSAVSYTSRNKYLTNGDKIYSNVIQETRRPGYNQGGRKDFQQQPRRGTNNKGGQFPGSSRRNDHFSNK